VSGPGGGVRGGRESEMASSAPAPTASGGPSHSEVLRAKIGLAYPRLSAVSGRFWSHPELAALYPEFLFTVHTMIRSSVPMMEEAAAAARHLAGEGRDPTAPLLAEYFERHAREEAGHDDWLLDDLEALGTARATVWGRIPSRHVAAMVGAYYYWVRHVHPVALLSYLAVLEGNPPVVEQLEVVQRSTGLPREAFRTLIKHAQLDPHHRDDLNDLIDRLPLTAEHHQLLALSAFHTIEQVSLVLQEVLDARRR
jgi:hypothetical protein